MKEILNYSLFSFGNVDFTIASLITLLLFWVSILVFLRIIKKIIYRFDKIDLSKKYSLNLLLRYLIYFISIVISLQLIGLDTTILITGSTALLVGLGLGIQYLFSDYVSGIIILMDSSIKVGDIIEIDGLICKVIEINLRTSKVITRDDKYLLLPNTDLTRKHIINWTHQKIDSRFDVSVGVDYTSDPEQVMQIMVECAMENPNINKEPKPFVRFNNFGESSIDFTLYFWTADVFRVGNIQSEIRISIFKAFRKHNIHIPFPQRVIHTK
ncbi:MAG: mechanosensitive ion channel [Chloroflexia bacterium]|nr:mechanosensitive ion channel [Chloroflexia bacterium]